MIPAFTIANELRVRNAPRAKHFSSFSFVPISPWKKFRLFYTGNRLRKAMQGNIEKLTLQSNGHFPEATINVRSASIYIEKTGNNPLANFSRKDAPELKNIPTRYRRKVKAFFKAIDNVNTHLVATLHEDANHVNRDPENPGVPIIDSPDDLQRVTLDFHSLSNETRFWHPDGLEEVRGTLSNFPTKFTNRILARIGNGWRKLITVQEDDGVNIPRSEVIEPTSNEFALWDGMQTGHAGPEVPFGKSRRVAYYNYQHPDFKVDPPIRTLTGGKGLF